MPVKNTLFDLNDHLFEQLEKLNDDDLKGPELDTEIKRAKSMIGIAHQVVEVADVVLAATKMKIGVQDENEVPTLLVGNDRKKKSKAFTERDRLMSDYED